MSVATVVMYSSDTSDSSDSSDSSDQTTSYNTKLFSPANFFLPKKNLVHEEKKTIHQKTFFTSNFFSPNHFLHQKKCLPKNLKEPKIF